MIKLSYEEIVQRIKNETKLGESEITSRIDKKLKQLSDLISKEGAAHIVANELNVKLFDNVPMKLKIKDVIGGLNNVNITGKVIGINEVRNFKTDKREGRVASLLIGDETGTIRVVLWDEKRIKELEEGKIRFGDVIKIISSYSKENNGFKELHIGSRASIIVNPENEKIEEVKFVRNFNKKQIADLQENDNVSLLGTIVKLFEPKFYEVCSLCNKRVRLDDGGFVCEEHGPVQEKLATVINMYFDDGTGSLRIVFFRDLVSKLLNLKEEETLELRGNNDKFLELQRNFEGKQLQIFGRVVKNNMFDRLEFIANDVYEPSPSEIADELSKEMNLE